MDVTVRSIQRSVERVLEIAAVHLRFRDRAAAPLSARADDSLTVAASTREESTVGEDGAAPSASARTGSP